MSFFQKLLGYANAPTPDTHGIPLFLHNTMSGKKEVFTSRGPYVRMYNCGPTVYGTQHLGNLSMFVFTDILRRTLEYNGHTVKQVINITDVGHLVSDGDDGDDKMTKGLKREGLDITVENMALLAERYTQLFLSDLRALGVDTEHISFPRATHHIPGQIALIQTLQEKGYTYKIKDGVYFDTGLFPDYGKLGNIKIDALKEGARVGIVTDKKNPADFALWKFNPHMGWDTPWGKGFPGWHIECSAMCRSELGEQVDIHTGGIEHIPVHHNNEIAQSEAAFGKKPFARFWLHRAHVQLDGHKIAKSEGNVVYLSDLAPHGIHPYAFRYWLLTSHYRTPANLTWEALSNAQTALSRLHRMYKETTHTTAPTPLTGSATQVLRTFHERMNDDLDTPGALAALWTGLKTLTSPEQRMVLDTADRVCGFGLKENLPEFTETFLTATDLPEVIQTILHTREKARAQKDWEAADAARMELLSHGYTVTDTKDGYTIIKTS